MKEAKIDLNRFRSEGVKVYSGRIRGDLVRKELKLDSLEKNYDHIDVEIPNDIYAISASFFLSLFGDSIRTLGKEKFLSIYDFKVDDPLIRKDIEEGVDRATKLHHVL